jgi:hypothetical protein
MAMALAMITLDSPVLLRATGRAFARHETHLVPDLLRWRFIAFSSAAAGWFGRYETV